MTTEKRCACCKNSLPLSLFSIDRRSSDGFVSYCKSCRQDKNRAYYVNKRKKLYSKEYKSRDGLSVSNPNAYARIWNKANTEKRSAALKRYAEKNRDKMRAKGMKRYADQTGQTPKWVGRALNAETEGLYMYCQIFNLYKSDRKDKFQVDHIVPIKGKQVSGLHLPWNLQVLTGRENVQKGNTFKPSAYPQQGQCAFTEM